MLGGLFKFSGDGVTRMYNLFLFSSAGVTTADKDGKFLYWWNNFDEESKGIRHSLKAADRDEAKAIILKERPDAVFWDK